MPETKGCDFDSIALDSHVQTDCSPQFDEFDMESKWIRITAPSQVEAVFDEEEGVVDPGVRFPVCIAIQFPLKELLKYQEPRAAITLVLVNQATGEAISGNLAYTRPRKPLPKPDLSKEEIEGRVQRYFFNVNLVNYLRLPPVKATYYLHALFGEYKSNTVTIDFKE